ncbi:MAG: DsbA family protein [Halomonadaceae bacterium]|nr:MAG: DsbA family protein [Halomonadaceae bacterium]
MGEAKRRQHTGAPSNKSVKEQRQQRLFWGIGITVVIAVIALVLYLVTPGAGPTGQLPAASGDRFPAELDQYGVQRGDPDAPVVVREFADYQCPACASFASQTHERLLEQYIDTGKVRLVFFEMPLRQHRNAIPAAMAARCAGDQGSYWDMQQTLFDRQSRWSNSNDPINVFTGYGEDLGLNTQRLERCLRNERRLEDVEASLNVAQQLRVAATPTVLVDSTRLSVTNWEQLSGVIERQLQAGD